MQKWYAYRVLSWHGEQFDGVFRHSVFSSQWSDCLFLWVILALPLIFILPILFAVDVARFVVHCSRVGIAELSLQCANRESSRRERSSLLDADCEIRELERQVDQVALMPQEREALNIAISRKRLKKLKEAIDGN